VRAFRDNEEGWIAFGIFFAARMAFRFTHRGHGEEDRFERCQQSAARPRGMAPQPQQFTEQRRIILFPPERSQASDATIANLFAALTNRSA